MAGAADPGAEGHPATDQQSQHPAGGGLPGGTYDSPAGLRKSVRRIIPFWVKIKTYSAISSSSFSATRPVAPNRGTYIGGCKAAERQDTYSLRPVGAGVHGVDTLPCGPHSSRASRLAILPAARVQPSPLRRSRAVSMCRVAHSAGSTPRNDREPAGGGGEGDLDTGGSGGPARGSSIDVIESPEVGGTFYLAWAAAFGLPRLPDAVSQSYGLCERVLDEELLILSVSASPRFDPGPTRDRGDHGHLVGRRQRIVGLLRTGPDDSPAVDYPTSSPSSPRSADRRSCCVVPTSVASRRSGAT